ncbi:MAG: hypothetical protein WC876_02785 [Candidatus Thermoplasmatota archaeon]|jgi:hypothetical protein
MKFQLTFAVLFMTLVSQPPPVQGEMLPDCRAPDCQPPACGMVTEPQCWAVYFTCYWVRGPLYAIAPTTYCPVQPDCCGNGTEANTQTSSARLVTLPDPPCRNYGIQVNIVAIAEACGGNCKNYGLEVNVVISGSRCEGYCENYGVSVSIGHSCDQTGVVVCVEAFCYPGSCRSCFVLAFQATGPQSCDWSKPTVVVMDGCEGQCVNHSIGLVVGIWDCDSCANAGIVIVVGFYCDRGGVGVCIPQNCKWVVDRSEPADPQGQSLNQALFMPIGPFEV